MRAHQVHVVGSGGVGGRLLLRPGRAEGGPKDPGPHALGHPGGAGGVVHGPCQWHRIGWLDRPLRVQHVVVDDDAARAPFQTARVGLVGDDEDRVGVSCQLAELRVGQCGVQWHRHDPRPQRTPGQSEVGIGVVGQHHDPLARGDAQPGEQPDGVCRPSTDRPRHPAQLRTERVINRFRRASRTSMSMGLAIQSSAPARRPSISTSGESCPVMTSTGRSRTVGRALISRVTS